MTLWICCDWCGAAGGGGAATGSGQERRLAAWWEKPAKPAAKSDPLPLCKPGALLVSATRVVFVFRLPPSLCPEGGRVAGKLWETRGVVQCLAGRAGSEGGAGTKPVWLESTNPALCQPTHLLPCLVHLLLSHLNVLSCKINIPHVLCHIFPGKNSSQGERIF